MLMAAPITKPHGLRLHSRTPASAMAGTINDRSIAKTVCMPSSGAAPSEIWPDTA